MYYVLVYMYIDSMEANTQYTTIFAHQAANQSDFQTKQRSYHNIPYHLFTHMFYPNDTGNM